MSSYEKKCKILQAIIDGMFAANAFEEHASQFGTYGKFYEALESFVHIEWPENAVDIMERYTFDYNTGEELYTVLAEFNADITAYWNREMISDHFFMHASGKMLHSFDIMTDIPSEVRAPYSPILAYLRSYFEKWGDLGFVAGAKQRIDDAHDEDYTLFPPDHPLAVY